VRILRAADRLATPWKNGLGVTREIAVHPPGAGLDDFDWRISMATVGAGGPFSIFPGIDRTLAVLKGRLSLSLDSVAPIELDPDSKPLAFPGDVPVQADLIAGPVTDLNVMTRRGRVQSAVERVEIDVAIELAVSSTTIILTRTDGVSVLHSGRSETLQTNDAVWFDQTAQGAVLLEPLQHTVLFVIRLPSL
jgi:uncharacterized protein